MQIIIASSNSFALISYTEIRSQNKTALQTFGRFYVYNYRKCNNTSSRIPEVLNKTDT